MLLANSSHPAALSSCLITVWLQKAYLNHNILHMVKLFRVEEGCELFSVCCQVPVHVRCFEPPLITGKHLLKAELVCRILKILRVGWEDD